MLESLVATTYQIDFEFLEEELLAAALGVRSPVSRERAFRSELERTLQQTEVSVLYDIHGCERLARLSPRIDPIPICGRKQHAKISLLMWVRKNGNDSAAAERRIRLIVGSANLTRQGFRQNYECVAALDYGGRSTSPRVLLTKAIELVEQIGAESRSKQLSGQLKAFRDQAALLLDGSCAADDPVALVAAGEVVPAIRETWSAMLRDAPERVTVVSPFWSEGSTAADALVELYGQLGSPAKFELVCGSEPSADRKTWLPVFDRGVASALRKKMSGRLFLSAAQPEESDALAPDAVEPGDESEDNELVAKRGMQNGSEVQRSLHA